MSFQRRRARRAGFAGGRRGAVTVIQRFGGGLRLTIHLHTLLVDGVFYETNDGGLFLPLPPPSDADVARDVATVRTRVQRILGRCGAIASDALSTDHFAIASASPASSVLGVNMIG